MNDPTVNGNNIYNDILAIADGLTTVTGTMTSSSPANWYSAGQYWAATDNNAGHYMFAFSTGLVLGSADGLGGRYVALQVL